MLNRIEFTVLCSDFNKEIANDKDFCPDSDVIGRNLSYVFEKSLIALFGYDNIRMIETGVRHHYIDFRITTFDVDDNRKNDVIDMITKVVREFNENSITTQLVSKDFTYDEWNCLDDLKLSKATR